MQPSKSLPLLPTERAEEGAEHTRRCTKEGGSCAKAHASLDHGSRRSSSVKNTHRSPDGGPSKARVVEDPAMSPTRKSSSSKTVFRRLTTKLRLPLSSALPKPPPHTSSYAAQGGREAALRARGLLPPLQPNPDLSTQEQEQDLRYSVVVPLQDVDSDIDITAAKKIKQEWEARNQALSNPEEEAMLVRTRLQSFKFGGSAVSLGVPEEVVISVTNDADHLSDQLAPPTPPEAPAIEVSTCNADDGPPTTPTPPNTRSRLGRPPALDLSQARRRSLSKPRPSPTGPLPPLPADAEVVYSPRCIPLPASQPTTPNTPSSAINRSLPPPASSPPAQPTLSKDNAATPLSPRSYPTSQSPKLKPDEMHSNLETHSQGDTTSSIDSSMASSHQHAFKVKAIEHGIPAILESLVEEKMNSAKLQPAFEIEDRVEQQHASPADVLVIPQRSKDTRRKSFGLFRRDNSDAVSVKSAASSQSKKNGVFNLRRSIFGPLSRKSVDKQRLGNAFDASHLPPSPTLPLSFTDQAKSTNVSTLPHSQSSPALAKARALPLSNKRGTAMPSPPQSPRQAVSPKMHIAGVVYRLKPHGIEDEESRRLCELAFIN
ncbi:hypothetical protein PC9H_009748 [Pleurotus ostreatus]|uniref:Uncharacterized protein n=1 Tax=Pleurotus ostreatus TaxID=5322 RepID=A0A8H6ZRA0_PLEOS|nr:uncharacterized protein PC9H_009748 [Pleurotus ostreatus]KAF7424441.1 hypothetical protein PC9H_009748 [Pleurotus ostreatus]